VLLRLHYSVTLLALLATNCEQQKLDRKSRPTDETEEILGYLDSTERDVPIDLETSIQTGDTEVIIPAASAESSYRVRVSRRESAPELSAAESVVLGSPKSDVVDVAVYRNDTILSSDELLLPYEFSQTFATTESTSKLGLYVLTNPGTSYAERKLLPNSELKIEPVEGLRLSNPTKIRVSLKLRLTQATLWLVTYTDEALSSLEVEKADSIMSTGGSSAQTTTVRRTSSFSGAAVSINSGASYTSSAAVTLSLTASGATEMYITGTSGCAIDGSWEDFSATKAWTLTTLNGVSRVYAKFKNAAGSESSCVSASIIHDNIAPSTPASLNDGTSHQSLIASPTISWTASSDGGSGISHYEIAIGSTAGGTEIKTWTSVGNTASGMITGLSLTNNATYYASVRALDAAGNISEVTEGNGWTATSSSLNCPTNYVKIPANSDLGTSEFCVMKYEAKDVSSVATSQASLTPWVNIARGTDATTAGGAWKACKDLNTTNPVSGLTFDLITNAQWQAVARNIEGVSSNWSNGNSSGSNALNRGHSDNSPYNSLAASTDDDPCSGTGDTNCATNSHVDFTQRRTHTLSNGEVIWDIAGNVWEWVQENYMSQGSMAYVSQLTSPTYNLLRWGPAGNYTAKSSGEYGGLGYGNLDYSAGAVLRGGSWSNDNSAGVFASNLDYDSTNSIYGFIGFRCAAVGGP
jgi:hypothetical protein